MDSISDKQPVQLKFRVSPELRSALVQVAARKTLQTKTRVTVQDVCTMALERLVKTELKERRL